MAEMAYKSVQDWYNGKSFSITDPTWYMGKVLIEKIVRFVPKHGQRIALVAKLPLFEKNMERSSAALKKIVSITGDLFEDDWTVSQKERDLLVEQVSIVLHLGSTLKLEEDINDAVKLNTEGTLTLLQFAKEVKNLEVFVHVSTAFCNSGMLILKEWVYSPTQDPHEIIKFWRGKTMADVYAKESIITPCSNSDMFSFPAEAVVHDMNTEVRAVVPSIVLPTVGGPFPGSVDSLNGIMRAVVAAGKTMYCDENTYLKVIHVDSADTEFFSITHARANTSPKKTVYKVTTANLMAYKDVLAACKLKIFKHSSEWILWLSDCHPTKNRFIKFFLHCLSVYFMDFLLTLFIQKRFMIRVPNKISFGLKLLEYFTMRDWIFRNDKALDLESNLSKGGGRTFPVASSTSVNIDKYLEDTFHSVRTYVRENPKTLLVCRIHIKFWYCLHITTQIILCYYLLKPCLGLIGASALHFF